MRLTGLYSARESLISQGSALATIADNIANVNTPGFKNQRPEFSNLLADSEGSLFGSPLNPGNGVKVDTVRSFNDKQGTLEPTGRSLDAAISGNGFFVISPDGTEQKFTRAGNFSLDNAGNLVTSNGLKVMGFTGTDVTTPTAISLTTTSTAAKPSTAGKLTGNIDSSTPVNATLPAATSFRTLKDGAAFDASVRVYDSLGAAHDVSLYFFHTAALGYNVQAYVDSGETTAIPGTPVAVGNGSLTFDSAGAQAAGAGATLALSTTFGNQSAPLAVNLDLSGLTGFSATSNLSAIKMDGNPTGNPTGYEIAEDGSVNILTDSGVSIAVAKLAIAKFNNPEALDRDGSNIFSATDASGAATLNTATVEGRGSVAGGNLENSTADTASEFIDMIRYQRAYQASSQVITTLSEIIASTVQIL
ncbi:MAG: flagellar hook protein FlgE [Proteobacteria bacterium]|nr:flagellar hook protein FlgE [Pseudomonadota bacterium]